MDTKVPLYVVLAVKDWDHDPETFIALITDSLHRAGQQERRLSALYPRGGARTENYWLNNELVDL